MRYKKEPKNFEVLHKLYLSIGYYQGKAIVKDENGSFAGAAGGRIRFT